MFWWNCARQTSADIISLILKIINLWAAVHVLVRYRHFHLRFFGKFLVWVIELLSHSRPPPVSSFFCFFCISFVIKPFFFNLCHSPNFQSLPQICSTSSSLCFLFFFFLLHHSRGNPLHVFLTYNKRANSSRWMSQCGRAGISVRPFFCAACDFSLWKWVGWKSVNVRNFTEVKPWWAFFFQTSKMSPSLFSDAGSRLGRHHWETQKQPGVRSLGCIAFSYVSVSETFDFCGFHLRNNSVNFCCCKIICFLPFGAVSDNSS